MIAIISGLCGLALFGILTRRTWLGVLLNVQLLFVAAVLALMVLAPAPSSGAKTHGVALIMLIFGNLQVLLGLGFAVRLRRLGLEPTMANLNRMKH